MSEAIWISVKHATFSIEFFTFTFSNAMCNTFLHFRCLYCHYLPLSCFCANRRMRIEAGSGSIPMRRIFGKVVHCWYNISKSGIVDLKWPVVMSLRFVE